MRVFVVISSLPYEGEEFHGVYATLAGAVRCAEGVAGWIEGNGVVGKPVTAGKHFDRGVRWEFCDYRSTEVREVELGA